MKNTNECSVRRAFQNKHHVLALYLSNEATKSDHVAAF